MFEKFRALYQNSKGQIVSKNVAGRELNASDVIHSLSGHSGNSLVKLLLDANSDASALSFAPVRAARQFIAESVSNMPLFVYDEDKNRATNLPAYKLLHDSPNEYQAPSQWKKASLQCAFDYGQSFSVIERNGLGEPGRLVLLDNCYVTVKFEGGEKAYEYKSPTANVILKDSDIFHLLVYSDDGISGVQFSQRCGNVVRVGIAVENYALRFFTKGHTGNRYIKLPIGTTQEQYEEIVKAWRVAYDGEENQWVTPILPYGAELVDMQPPNNESQLLELRKYQLQEVARITGVKPHVLHHYENGGTYANLEAQNVDLVQSCLQKWITAFEDEATRKLCPTGYKAEFLIDARLRGDTLSRYQAYKIGREGGWLSTNDILRMENRPTIGPEGDVYLNTPPGAAPNDAPPTETPTQEPPKEGEATNE